MIDEDLLNIVIPGDLITAEEGYMKYFIQLNLVDTELIVLKTESTVLCWEQSKLPTN